MIVARAPAKLRVLDAAARDAAAEAADIVSHARVRAAAIIVDASRVRDEIAERATADAAAYVTAERAAARLEAAAEVRHAGAEVRALALEVARAVIGESALVASDVLDHAVRRALAPLRRARGVVLRVHPSDAATLRERWVTWVPDAAATELVDVIEDATISRGGVVVESDVGRSDARIETQLELLAKVLEGG